MTHRFVILLNGELKTYDDYNAIPLAFDNVIEFSPSTPEGTHTEDQHIEIDSWNNKLKELLKREMK
jgi:hypothetical protein